VLDRDGGFVSTIDLFGSGFVLFAGPYGGAWAAAGTAVAGRLGVRLTPYVLGEELKDPDGSFARAYGLGDGGPRWVRPDGYVAWRSGGLAGDPEVILEDALTRHDGGEPARRARSSTPR
jgi:hypothetical protein